MHVPFGWRGIPPPACCTPPDQPCWEAVFKFVMMGLSVEVGVGGRRGAKKEEGPADGNGFARLSQMGNPDLDPVAAESVERDILFPADRRPRTHASISILKRSTLTARCNCS